MSLYAVTRENGEALYAQIARQLEQEIASLYSPGDFLPSEGVLAARFGVNRHTLRRAIDELVDAGMLERHHGRGVAVLDSQLDYQIGTGTRFTENLAALGMLPTSRLVRKQTLPAIRRVAERLHIDEGDPVYWLETLRTADERPMCVSSHFISARLFPDLSSHYDGGSLHAFLADRYGCRLRRTESLVTAVLPQGDDAKWLRMPQNRPVLRVKSVNVDDRDGTPIEYAITRFRADRIQLRINL
ncbi:MAG: phosphonate metabolism transcriptional regulator PhnF [Pigmentiphaga sp.]|uniref:phosphonate metabolism transcriptional regulator PhnF n=1 Tax=Pigmentiphaga sp. TaxID=1977564 RepID=UPI0029A76294|nr:phosphonate metabolism transcriptional regulator PhnF [Pigmentiphaga sp.]MDX3904888.1 phosphonate metabolism transcriptional regulator PhnF [Pigmentiphaga sp.]